jgi:hypothetical protein
LRNLTIVSFREGHNNSRVLFFCLRQCVGLSGLIGTIGFLEIN